jgi:hypothetical protein
MSAARVVDFPEPVAPVTRISPRFCITSVVSASGNPNCVALGKSMRMRRATSPTWPRWRNTFRRKRPTPATRCAVLSSLQRSNSWASAARSAARMMASTAAPSSVPPDAGTVAPSTR